MRRRTFVSGALATALAATLLNVRRAAAEPITVGPHPRLLLHDFTGVTALIAAAPDAAAWYAKVRDDAEDLLGQPVAEYVIPDGLRLLDTSRETIRRVYSLGFAYGVEGDDRYLDRLWAELAAVAAFPDWNHHRHFLDTAEMTHAVALGYDWFHDRWTAEQRATLENAIIEFGLRPGIEVYQGNGTGASRAWHTADNNWNIVCNGGLIVGALALADVADAPAQQVIDYALASLPKAVALYGPDGGYPEGLGSYWGYATKYLVLLIEALRTATDDDHGLTESPGLAETGMFPIQLTGPTEINFNYYDAGGSAPRPPEMFWLARTYQRPEFGWWGKTGADLAGPSWFQTPTSLLWYDPELAKGPIESGTPLDAYFGLCEVATMRSGWESDGAVFVGAKAGDNTTNHGDLDLGDFVLDALGVRWAVELGSDNYNLPGYFAGGPGGQRWTYYRKRAEGQNTLIVNPGPDLDQRNEATGVITDRASGPTEAYAIADLAEAAPDLRGWRRGWRLIDQRGQLVVQDELAADEPVEVWWFLHTTAVIAISGDGRSATLSAGGRTMIARITGPADAVFYNADARPLWTSPDPAGQGVNAGIRKLAIRLTGVTDLRLAVQFTPLHPDQPLPDPASVRPLDDWTTGPAEVARLKSIMVDGEQLPGFAPDNFNYHHNLPQPLQLTADAAAPDGRVRIRTRTEDGSVQVAVTAPGSQPSTYRIWPVITIGPGSFPATIVASSDDGNAPANTMDGDPATRWSAEGDGEWIGYDLGSDGPVDEITIAWYQGDRRASIFDIEVAAADETTWRPAFQGTSSGTSAEPERYAFPATTARYLRIVGHGNTANAWNSITEVSIPGRTVEQPAVDPYLATVRVTAPPVLVGATATLGISGTMNDGSAADLSGTAVEYVSTAPAVATIDDSGLITGRTIGRTTFAGVIVTDDHRLVYGRAEVEVTDPLRPRIPATADLYVNDGAQSGTNYGTATQLLIKTVAQPDSGYSRQAFVRFEAPPVSGTIESVILFVRASVNDTGGTECELDVLGVDGTIDEKTTTWQTKPALGAPIGSALITSTAAWHEIDVTAAVTDALAAGTPITLALVQVLATGEAGLATRVSSRETSDGAYLQVKLAG
ncbi:DNRLRE domain-containing protein [Microlunatus sp. GCM10028923]|uniref:CBM96 family carbohydrate-binding protein n=1 Tax=Microlunatus sp. GCM10028923 TaxID=3273400 RepID=UPI0036164674